MTNNNKQQGSASAKILLIIVCILVIGGIIYVLVNHSLSSQVTAVETPPVVTTNPTPTNTYGMSQYTDSTYGFSFWYPTAEGVTSTATNDTTNFPGGTAVETLQLGSMGDTTVYVVDSPSSTITDESNNHASPIPQTKYSYNSATGTWMLSYPEGPNEDGKNVAAPKPADTSKTTVAGLFMLGAGRRFDTTIIPLTPTRFLVVTDGGGSFFTTQLAATIAPTGVTVTPSVLEAALQAESTAYDQGNKNQ